jgi:NifU-like protein involved in Fe-S cluster formation
MQLKFGALSPLVFALEACSNMMASTAMSAPGSSQYTITAMGEEIRAIHEALEMEKAKSASKDREIAVLKEKLAAADARIQCLLRDQRTEIAEVCLGVS